MIGGGPASVCETGASSHGPRSPVGATGDRAPRRPAPTRPSAERHAISAERPARPAPRSLRPAPVGATGPVGRCAGRRRGSGAVRSPHLGQRSADRRLRDGLNRVASASSPAGTGRFAAGGNASMNTPAVRVRRKPMGEVRSFEHSAGFLVPARPIRASPRAKSAARLAENLEDCWNHPAAARKDGHMGNPGVL